MKIGNKIVNQNDIFFWVEEGQASLGNVDSAMKYINTARSIGADGIEFQLAIPEEFYVASHPYIEHYRNIQYSIDQIGSLIEYSKNLEISFIATVLSKSLIDPLAELGCDAFVINASDINNPGIIDPVVKSKVPFFISLPLASEIEIEWIVKRCLLKGADNFTLMLGQHTMASGDKGVHPEDSNLGYISTLRDKFKLPVGYIDHSTNIAMPAIARAAGANYISKHISLNKSEKGPDWFVCIEPSEMKEAIQLTRKINRSLANKEKVLAPGEQFDITVMRRSIVAAFDIPKGTEIKLDMIDFKRPGTGMAPNSFESIIGKTVVRNISKDEIINVKDITQ